MLKRLLEKVENKDIFMFLIFVFALGYRTYYWPNEIPEVSRVLRSRV